MIRYIFGSDSGEASIEYFAAHRMTNDRRVRIYDSGRIESLEALQDLFVYTPAAGNKKKAEKDYVETNRRIAAELARTNGGRTGIGRGSKTEDAS